VQCCRRLLEGAGGAIRDAAGDVDMGAAEHAAAGYLRAAKTQRRAAPPLLRISLRAFAGRAIACAWRCFGSAAGSGSFRSTHCAAQRCHRAAYLRYRLPAPAAMHFQRFNMPVACLASSCNVAAVRWRRR